MTILLLAVSFSVQAQAALGDKSGGEEWQIRQREQWFVQSRGLNKVERPDLLRAAAVRELAERLAYAPQVSSWQSLGPESMTMLNWVMGPVAGRVTALAVHPSDENILFLGTASGGLWKSTTGGNSWTQLFDQVGTQSIGSIYVEPGNPNNVWVGTGEQGQSCLEYFGLGLFKSTNGGATFQPMNGSGANKLDLSYVSAVVVHPTNPAIVLAGGHAYCNSAGSYLTGGLYRSTDGGANWALSLSGPVGDILVDPVTPNTMYAGVGRWGFAGDGVYKTTNAGASWTRLTAAPLPFGSTTRRMRLAMAPNNSQVLYALINQSDSQTHLYKTTNAGASWSQTNGSACEGQCSYNLCMAVNPGNSSTVLVGSIRHFRSTSSGASPVWVTATWGASQTVHQDTHVLRYSTANSNRYWVGSDGGLWRTDDGGTSFVNLNSNLHITQFYDVAVHPGNTLAVWGGAQDNSSSGRFAAQQWNVTVVTGDGFLNLIDPGDTNTVFQTSYPSGAGLPSVVRSISGGGPNTFSWLSTNGLVSGELYPWVTPMAIYDHDAAVPTYVFLGSNYVYRARSDQPAGSFTWTKISPALSGTDSVNVLTPVKNGSNLTLYAGTFDGRIQRTNNGLDASPAWTDVTGNFPAGTVSDIAVDRSNPLRVFATRGAFGDAKLWRSTSGGSAWSGVGGGLPDVPANTVAIDPLDTNRIFVGTDVGIYQSLDGGNSFQPVMSGLPLGVVVTDLEIDDSPHALVAGTYGRGAWWLDLGTPTIQVIVPNGGETWVSGSVHAVSWTASGLNPLGQLQLHWWNGSAWNYIATVPQGTTSYSWTVPAQTTSAARIFVGNAVNGAWEASDQSDQPFSIVAAGSGPPGDFDGNGKPDVIWQNDTNGQASVWLLGGVDGLETVGFGWLLPGGDPVWRVAGTADFNGDGHPDVIWRNESTGQAAVWFMGGANGLTMQSFGWIHATGDPNWRVVGAADFDGNGKPDVIWRHISSGQASVWFMGGADGLTQQGFGWIHATGDSNWRIVGAADFDGNGKPDLIWRHVSNGQASVWFMGGANGLTQQGFGWISAGVDPNWRVVGSDDFDGNGKPDVVWQQVTTRQAAVWLMGGANGLTLQRFAWLHEPGAPGWTVTPAQ